MAEKRITFGIAVYNVERYLESCIKSVIAQQGEDIDVIIVDDGSTDSSGEICDRLAAMDSRVRVFHTENKGVSNARNIIIEKALGSWISYIDGDDMLTADAAEKMRGYAETDYDIVFFDSLFFRVDNSIPTYVRSEAPLIIDNTADIEELAMSTLYRNASSPDYINKTVVTIWGKMYRRQFLMEHSIRFDLALRKSQDVAFSLVCVRELSRCIFVRQATYLHRKNEFSIVARYNPKITEYNTLLADAFRAIVEKYPPHMQSGLLQRYYMMCIIIMKTSLQLDFCHKNNKKPYKQRQAEYEKYKLSSWFAEAMRLCDRAALNKSDGFIVDNSDNFKEICRYFKKRDIDTALRNFSAKIGLNKLRSRLRQHR